MRHDFPLVALAQPALNSTRVAELQLPPSDAGRKQGTRRSIRFQHGEESRPAIRAERVGNANRRSSSASSACRGTSPAVRSSPRSTNRETSPETRRWCFFSFSIALDGDSIKLPSDGRDASGNLAEHPGDSESSQDRYAKPDRTTFGHLEDELVARAIAVNRVFSARSWSALPRSTARAVQVDIPVAI